MPARATRPSTAPPARRALAPSGALFALVLGLIAGTGNAPTAMAQEDTAGAGVPATGVRATGARAALTGATTVTRDVRARAGERLADLARRELGSAGLARPLAEFNALDITIPLAAGQIVRVPIRVPARGETALAVFVKGEVRRGALALARGDLLAVGDIVSTGPSGFVSIEFSSGSVINLQPDTRVGIIRLSCLVGDDSCLIDLEAGGGQLDADVEARDGQPVEFRVDTPFASAAVRGTVFDVHIVGDEVRAAVTEGAVTIAAQRQSVQLDQGFGSVTREGEVPGPPRALPLAPVFRTLPTRVTAGEFVTWFALDEVASYVATLSRDAAGRQPVIRIETDTPRLEIPEGIESGDHHVTLRGIDASGLPGFHSVVRLAIATVDTSVAPLAVTVTREAREFLVRIIEPPEGAPGFEIQVSTTPDFEDPLSIEVDASGQAVLRLDSDTLYARARTLIDPFTVSPFGAVASGG